jgi:archaellum component FlaC
MASHELEKVKDYYEGITGKIKEMDPNLEKRKNQLEELLNLVNLKMTEINHTTSVLQNELKIMFEDAIKSLQAISRRKLSYLISDHL